MDKKQVIGRYIIEIHDDGTISGREITFNKFGYLKTLTGHGEIYSETDDIELKRLLMLKITSRKKGASDYIALEKFFRNPEIDIVISESSVRNIQSSKERSDKRLATMNKKSIA